MQRSSKQIKVHTGMKILKFKNQEHNLVFTFDAVQRLTHVLLIKSTRIKK